MKDKWLCVAVGLNHLVIRSIAENPMRDKPDKCKADSLILALSEGLVDQHTTFNISFQNPLVAVSTDDFE